MDDYYLVGTKEIDAKFGSAFTINSQSIRISEPQSPYMKNVTSQVGGENKAGSFLGVEISSLAANKHANKPQPHWQVLRISRISNRS